MDAAALRAEGLLGKQSARVVEKEEEEVVGGCVCMCVCVGGG